MERPNASLLGVAFLLLSLTACGGKSTDVLPNSSVANPPATQGNVSAVLPSLARHPMDGGDTYTAQRSRNLDTGDDQAFWDAGGSFGQVSGGGGCNPRCLNVVTGGASVVSTPVGRSNGNSSAGNCGTRACPDSPFDSSVSRGEVLPSGNKHYVRPMTGGIPTIVVICTYQALVPGVHNVAVDTLLFCDWYDENGSLSGDNNNEVGVHHGPPNGRISCSSSPQKVDDSVIPHGTSDAMNVTDVNSVWFQGQVIGWIYNATDPSNGLTYRLVQANPGATPPANANLPYFGSGSTVDQILTYFFGFPTGSYGNYQTYDSGVYKLGQNNLQNSAKALKCFTGGGLWG